MSAARGRRLNLVAYPRRHLCGWAKKQFIANYVQHNEQAFAARTSSMREENCAEASSSSARAACSMASERASNCNPAMLSASMRPNPRTTPRCSARRLKAQTHWPCARPSSTGIAQLVVREYANGQFSDARSLRVNAVKWCADDRTPVSAKRLTWRWINRVDLRESRWHRRRTALDYTQPLVGFCT